MAEKPTERQSGTPGRERMGTTVQSSDVDRVSGGSAGRSSDSPIEWFGPGAPLAPSAPAWVAGRQLDYPVHYNLAQQPRSYESISFQQLRNLSDGYDLLRLVIETRKDQVEGYTWEIRSKKKKNVPDTVVSAAKEFFNFPDKEHPWNTWLRMLLEDIFVIDAAVIYPRKTRGDELYSLELMDGGTIKRVIDQTGRTPLPPDPAYQQVLKGLPAVNYTREELIYWMRNPRTNRLYGYSPVEQIIMTVNIALRRQVHQLQFYTEGSIPEAISGVPESWSVDTLKQFQLYWDTMMEGNTAQRRHMKFVPFDPSKMQFPKKEEMKDQFDEWLARIICFCFSISPTSLVKETNRATAESVQEAAKNEGLIPLLNWIKRFLNFQLQNVCGYQDLEFEWETNQGTDMKVQADVDSIYIKEGVITAEEVRERIGMAPFTPEQLAQKEKDKLMAMKQFKQEEEIPAKKTGEKPKPKPGKKPQPQSITE